MKTTPLPIQLASASPTPAPQRANANAGADARQFSQALSREMEQRRHDAAPAKAPVAPPASASAPAPAPASAPAAPAVAKAPAKPDAPAGDKDKDDAAAAADAAAVSPVTDMLALVASFNQPAAAAPVTDPLAASVAAQATALAGDAGKQPTADVAADALAAKVLADGTEPPLKDIKQVLDGAARFAVKVPGGAVAPEAKVKVKDGAELAAGGARHAGITTTSSSTTAPPADTAQKPDADGYAAVTAKAEPAPALVRAEAAPLRAREAVADVAALKEPAAAAPVSVPVQQASLAMAQAVTGAPTDRIAARVGTPGWDGQLGQKIVWMVAGKEQTASLTLNPPDMGPMQVVLSVTNDQATVTFSAAQPEVRQALENAMPKLREMMGESGIALGNATVNAGTPDQRQAQQGEQARNGGGGTARFGGGGAEAEPVSLAPARPARTGGGTGMVDTFA